MNENLENNDWIYEAPTLAAMGKRNPFAVTDGYFENCEEEVFSKIFLDSLKQKTNEHTFEIPLHYFEALTDRIETKIALGEIIKKEPNFTVPENYFDSLQSRITSKIAADEGKRTVKVIPLWKRSFVKYASAACFLLISSFGVYFYQNNETNISIPPAQLQSADFANTQMLYDIDESTIIEHLEAQNTSNTNTTSASDTEVENYILNNYSSSDLAQEL